MNIVKKVKSSRFCRTRAEILSPSKTVVNSAPALRQGLGIRSIAAFDAGSKTVLGASFGGSSKRRTYRRRLFDFIPRLNVCKIESERRQSFKKTGVEANG